MWKTIKFSILICLVFFGFYGYQALAQQINAEQNQKFSIILRMDEISDLSGFMLNVNFDSELISFNGAVKGDFLSSGCNTSLFSHKIADGKYIIGISRLGDCRGVSGSGDIATLNFESLGRNGMTVIRYSNSRFCVLKNNRCDWQNKIWDPVVVNILDKIVVLGVEYEGDSEDIEKNSLSEARAVLSQGRGFSADKASEEIYNKIIKAKEKNIKAEIKNSILYFIQNGAPSVVVLGAGERAGVINSYLSAYGKLPETAEEWQDAIKIANGRWPIRRDKATEKNAEAAFKKIYKRSSDRNNSNDDAAVVIISYGLRPANRNLESEKNAIAVFAAVYGYDPKSAEAWDIVRAIAYSGAER
ncbi:MAG: hypothetical protein GWO79_00375 [Actinobacteria bacterium]|nr:hypothetical protein [Actinomycetota bacterium]